MKRLTALLAVILSACGGGGSSTSAPLAAEPASIQLFGDSTFVRSASAYQSRWDNVTINAVGGSSSTQLIAGTDGLNAPWPQSVTARYVVINHGLNDGYKRRGRLLLTIEQYKANLRVLADAPAEVIFQTPLPSTRIGRDMAPYAQAMREVAAERGLRLIDVFACFQRLPAWESHLPDQVHPDAAGAERMAECAAVVIDRLPGVK